MLIFMLKNIQVSKDFENRYLNFNFKLGSLTNYNWSSMTHECFLSHFLIEAQLHHLDSFKYVKFFITNFLHKTYSLILPFSIFSFSLP